MSAPAGQGHRQSPIDIHPATAKFDQNLSHSPLLIHYVAANTKTVANNGMSITVATDPQGSCLTGGPLSHKYQIAQFHFHWGSSSDHGAEHKVDGHTYAAEAHLVHYNSDLFSSFAEAAKAEKGLCVMAVFFKTGHHHKAFQKVLDKAALVPYNGDKVDFVGGYDPVLLLPEDRNQYWTYPGSLTTPPYYESVTWVVFKNPIEVCEDQLECLRDHHRNPDLHKNVSEDQRDSHAGNNHSHAHFINCHQHKFWDDELSDNFREVKPMDGRIIRASFN